MAAPSKASVRSRMSYASNKKRKETRQKIKSDNVAATRLSDAEQFAAKQVPMTTADAKQTNQVCSPLESKGEGCRMEKAYARMAGRNTERNTLLYSALLCGKGEKRMGFSRGPACYIIMVQPYAALDCATRTDPC